MQRNHIESHKEHVFGFSLASLSPLSSISLLLGHFSFFFAFLSIFFLTEYLSHFLLSPIFFCFINLYHQMIFFICSNIIKIDFRATAGMKVIQMYMYVRNVD